MLTSSPHIFVQEASKQLKVLQQELLTFVKDAQVHRQRREEAEHR